MPRTSLKKRFTEMGVTIVEHALTDDDLEAMDVAFLSLEQHQTAAPSISMPTEDAAWLASHSSLMDLGKRLCGAPVSVTRLTAVRAKTPSQWFVPWRQLRSPDGCDLALLERMLILRIHLDDCEGDNGPVEVVPGTHREGLLGTGAVAEIAGRATPMLCLAARGDIVATRPLLLHRVQRARKPAARRVIEIECVEERTPRPPGGLN